MKEILLLGLQTDPNLGDGLIAECAYRLVNRILLSEGLDETYQPRLCDIRGVDYRKHLEEHYSKLEGIKSQKPPKKRGIGELILRAYCRVRPDSPTAKQRREQRKKLKAELRQKIENDITEYTVKRRRMLNKSAEAAAEREITDDTAAMIIVGGGLIKYGGHQELAEKLAPYFYRADRLGIPVMVNAVGVEGYDENSEECRLLVEMLNLPCVKRVSTRDDIETLRNKYIRNPDIAVSKVPCPALWTAELFPREPKRRGGGEKKVIGLGMARGQLFLDNGVDIGPEQLDGLWNGLIDELERRGYDWRIFTNGYNGDYHYAGRFIEKRIGKYAPEDETGENAGLADQIKEKLLPRPDSVGQLLDMITSFDCIAACRLHAAIAAYSYGIPAVEFVWNVKQIMFGGWINAPQYFIGSNDLEPEYIADTIERAIAEGYPGSDMDKNRTFEELKEFLTGNLNVM